MARTHTAAKIISFRRCTDPSADQRLKTQEEQYRLLFQTNPNPMWVFDPKTLAILAVNETAISLYNYSREEFLRLKLTDLRRPEDRAGLIKALSAPNKPSHFSGEFPHIKKDGSSIIVQIYSSPLLWDGMAARMVTAIDVTERRRAEERLREQAEMLDHAHDAIIVRNFDDRLITFWNSGAERLYGWSAGEAVGQPVDALVLAQPQEMEAIAKTLQASGEYRGVLDEVGKDGRELTVEVWSTVICDSDGNPRSVMSINKDITEQKKLETQLMRAQRLESIGTLASGVAHDLNNILTPILMCSQVVRAARSSEDRESALLMIEQSARRGAGIVKQVLTFARGIEGERVLIKPNHLIEEMIDIARKTFSRSIEISCRYSEELWSIEGDPTQLHQVLLNLSLNARDAMPSGGRLLFLAENLNVDQNYAAMIRDAKIGSYISISVSDNGAGMPRHVVEKIFDPFFTTKQIGKGTGLGLSTALGIVKSHGGFMSVYSEVDKGTTFRVFLPAKTNQELFEPAKIFAESPSGSGELILVVDDEESILSVTQTVLKENGYRVLGADDGPEAVAIFAREMNSISAVVTDMSMPLMDGLAVIRSLKKIKPSVPLIASTGQSGDAHAQQLQEMGVKHLLIKPYDTRKLLSVLREALGRSGCESGAKA
jgi:PAS domain S-box-containing protein